MFPRHDTVKTLNMTGELGGLAHQPSTKIWKKFRLLYFVISESL